MADSTLTKLLHLVAAGESTALRRAALTVLGSVGAKDAKLVKTLLDTLKDPDPDLRIAAIETLGQLHAEEALPHLEPFVRQGGAELEAAVHAAGLFGARGAKSMGKIMHEVSPHLRSRMAAVLAKSSTGNALVVTAQGLLDNDPKVIDATARSLAMEVHAYTPPQRHALAKFLIDSLGEKKIAPKAEAALIRVLAALVTVPPSPPVLRGRGAGGEGVEAPAAQPLTPSPSPLSTGARGEGLSALNEAKADDLFWARIVPPHAADVRAAALQALGTSAAPNTEKRLQALLACAGAKEFSIVAAALMILKKVPVSAKNSQHWIKLLEAPDVATRRFAVEKLQGVENAEVARAMLAQLRHPDRSLRDETLKALPSYAAGRAAMLDELLASADIEYAWFLARALAPSAKGLSAAQRAKVFAQAAAHHDADDRRAAALLFLLREMDHAWLRDQLEAIAQERLKKKKYAEAISYYRLLTQDPACSEESRFELAAAGLKESTRDLSADNRGNDPALHQFTRLLQNAAFDLIGHVAKAKWLAVEDLFYLGFHFAEQTHRAKEFGKQVLEIVIKRSPKTDVGKQAKRKLKSEGLA